jgi:ABC-type glutathione transport system ATPase component
MSFLRVGATPYAATVQPSLNSESSVDAHTAHHLYFECLKGNLMRGRTVIVVSHHVQLCASGASYVVALENGRVLYKGDLHGFQSSGVINSLAQSGTIASTARDDAEAVPDQTIKEELQTEKGEGDGHSPCRTEATSEDDFSGTVTLLDANPSSDKKGPRRLVEEETRAVGRIGRSVWETYIKACGGISYWLIFAVIFLLAAASPVAENGWLRCACHLMW